MNEKLSAEAVKQAGIALRKMAEGIVGIADALIILGGEVPQQPSSPAGDPPKVAAEKVARGRGKAESPPPPAAAAPAPVAVAVPALTFEKDVKPLVLKMMEVKTAEIGREKAVELGKALLSRYGADSFSQSPGKRGLDAMHFEAACDEMRRIIAGENTGAIDGVSDNDLGL